LRRDGDGNDLVRKLSRHIHDDVAYGVDTITARPASTTVSAFAALAS
jgi:hypothetical protein